MENPKFEIGIHKNRITGEKFVSIKDLRNFYVQELSSWKEALKITEGDEMFVCKGHISEIKDLITTLENLSN